MTGGRSIPALVLLAALAVSGTGQARQAVRLVGVAGALELARNRVAAAAPDAPAASLEVRAADTAVEEFCAGLGAETADGLVLLRRLRFEERERCAGNGVGELAELDLGDVGFLVVGAPAATLSRRLLWRALTAELAEATGLVANRALRWSEIDPSLPETAIRIRGPAPTSPGGALLAELVLEEACEAVPELARRLIREPKLRPRLCASLRGDGAYGEAAPGDSPPDSAATRLLDLRELDFRAKEAAAIEGVRPDRETIATGQYPLARRAWLTLKRAHATAIPGLSSLIAAAR